MDIRIEESATGRYGATQYVVSILDNGRLVMTFHTGNEMEAHTIGPELIAFLGG